MEKEKVIENAVFTDLVKYYIDGRITNTDFVKEVRKRLKSKAIVSTEYNQYTDEFKMTLKL